MSTATPDAGVPVRGGPERRAGPCSGTSRGGGPVFAVNWALAGGDGEHRPTDAPNAPTAWVVRTSLLRWDGTCPRLRRAWTAATSEIAPWWSECGTEAFNTGLDGVARSPEELGGLHVRPSVPAARWGSRASRPGVAPQPPCGSPPG